eukprot:COSAG02_NODE_2791_length_8022_cov_5.437208_12_plen_96_part_00
MPAARDRRTRQGAARGMHGGPEMHELQWDEFLTGLDEFDQGASASLFCLATTKGTEHNPVIGDLAISADISDVIIDANFGIGPRRALAWVVSFRC